MKRIGLLTVAVATLCPAQKPDMEFFEKKIRPVLAGKCYACHSSSSNPAQGGLLLDTKDGIRRGGASGKPGVTPNDPSHSFLLTTLKHTDAVKMPPGSQLPADVIADFETWIAMGAPDPREDKPGPAPPPFDVEKARRHWSYQPVRDPEPPAVADPLWNKTGIDRFVRATLDAKGLRPVGLASKRALIRRATYDLTGLPPTPEEVDAFLKDTSPGAFEKLVDRLLASPQYGERWGRHWMDVVRYADTAGCNSDFPVPDLYRYRNWIIQSFQNDKPYLDFLREQIAGDLLPARDDEDRNAKRVATTYVALSRRFASGRGEHHLTIDDTVDNIGKAMLGLTISCARCHDHKFDAISQRDYFGVYGIFESTIYAFPGVESFPRPLDFVALGPPEKQKELSEWEEKIRTYHEQIKELRFGEARLKPNAKEELEKVRGQVLSLELKPPAAPKAYGVREGEGHDAKMHYKGDPKKVTSVAPRGWLTVLGGQKLPPDEKGSGRRQLADWIADPANPLTARVMANRIWQWHMGKGLAATPNDFGVRGERPTHPELLDWLTSRFAESGYSVKKMHKLIMLTRTYQLASADDAANREKDPGAKYLWRFERRRLEAEEVRDSMLAISGQLDLTPGGAHPFPPLHEWTFSQHRQFFAVYDHNKRSVYLMQQRLRKHPLLELFDSPDPNSSVGVRNANVTALQALSLMNNDFVHKQADELAVRVGMAHSSTAGRIQFAHQLALGRPATPAEVTEGSAYITNALRALQDSQTPAERRPRAALASYLRALLASDEFMFVD